MDHCGEPATVVYRVQTWDLPIEDWVSRYVALGFCAKHDPPKRED
jgi:hypothetical protein